ncbi:MAG: SUMF1/EgtB/PvdO family nonheme iron enzyme, partial [Anaerolineales bacterium]
MSDYSPAASIGLLKRIPSGQLHMGSRFHPREYTRRGAVLVAEFELAHTPVTVNQYAAFLNSGAAHDARWWSADGWAWRCGGGEGWGRASRALPDGWEAQA